MLFYRIEGLQVASKNTQNVADGDVLIINELSEYLKYTDVQTKFLVDLAKKGIIAVETLLEEAISKVGKIKRSNKDGEDFVDGSDAKKAVVTLKDANTGERAASIGNVGNKKGILRVLVSEPMTEQLFFFKIPNREIKGKNSIKISFSREGGMQDKIRRTLILNSTLDKKTKIKPKSFSERAWLMYRVHSFKELCL